jgi:hypothetical protein
VIKMVENEAVAVLQFQLTGGSGLVAKLQRGEGIDAEGVRRVYEALDSLEGIWRDSQCIPKSVVQPLVDVFTPIYESVAQNARVGTEVRRLASDLDDRITRLLWRPAPHSMSEEEAMALIYGHLSGLPSVALALHHRGPLTSGWTDDLSEAIDTLAAAWRDRECVPKAIVLPMLSARSLIRLHAPAYPSQTKEIEAFADLFTNKVRVALASTSAT